MQKRMSDHQVLPYCVPYLCRRSMVRVCVGFLCSTSVTYDDAAHLDKQAICRCQQCLLLMLLYQLDVMILCKIAI